MSPKAVTRECVWCNRLFQVVPPRTGRIRRTCSRSCACKLANTWKGRRQVNGPWTETETDRWLDLSDRHPFDRAMGLYNEWAARTGHRQRTADSLRHHLQAMGESARPFLDGWNTGQLEEMLGISNTRILSWLEKGHVPRRRFGRWLAIYRKDLLRLAVTRPDLLGGIPADRLFLALDDRDLADRIAQAYPQALRHRRAVIRSDGHRYPSATAAAELNGLTDRRRFYHYVRTGRALNGYTFQFEDEATEVRHVS